MRRRQRERAWPPRFGMDDHDEMTGAQAWVDWQSHRDDLARLRAIAEAVTLSLSTPPWARPDPFGGPPPGSTPAGMTVHARPLVSSDGVERFVEVRREGMRR